VEDRLAVVVAQEKEVRVIVDEHLERESYLTKLLHDLYRKQKVGGRTEIPLCFFVERERAVQAGHVESPEVPVPVYAAG